MLNRKAEAKKAIDFAQEVADAYDKKDSILKVLQKYRKEDSLAVSPTEALYVRTIYADMIAEYYAHESSQEKPSEGEPKELSEEAPKVPSKEELEELGNQLGSLKDTFTTLFQKQGDVDYTRYARGVYDTHIAYYQFQEAMAAYWLLRPGKKNAPDATPDEKLLRKAIEDARKAPKTMTFDVYSNIVSPMERYARARSKLYPDGENMQSLADYAKEWRVPVELCKPGVSPEEIVLLTILYYRHEPKNVQNYTDFYPVSLREAGIYMTASDQGQAVNKLVNKQLPLPQEDNTENTAGDVAENAAEIAAENVAGSTEENAVENVTENAAESTAAIAEKAKTEKLKYLKFHTIYFPGKSQNERITMAAIKKEAVDEFVSCWKENALPENYLSIKGQKPRELLEVIRKTIPGKEVKSASAPVHTRDNNIWSVNLQGIDEDIRNNLLNRLRSVFSKEKLKGLSAEEQSLPKNVTDLSILKLCLAAHWISTDKPNQEKSVTCSDLEKMLSGNLTEVFNRLEDAKCQVFNAGKSQKAEGSEGKSSGHYLKFSVENNDSNERTIIYSISDKPPARAQKTSKKAKKSEKD